MKRKTLVLIAMVVACGALSPGAMATPNQSRYLLRHPKHQHCKPHYVRRVLTVKIHGHKVKRTYCVKVKPKFDSTGSTPKVSAIAPQPVTPAVATIHGPVHLHAHLDPTFTRDPTNPLKVTYSYSASATSESEARLSEAAPLPSGVLALYSNGVLTCAVNVGESVVGGECPVTYQTVGTKTVTTIYTAGEASATETEEENITPFDTTTTVSYTFTPGEPEQEIIGYLKFTVTTADEFKTLNRSEFPPEISLTNLNRVMFESPGFPAHGIDEPSGQTLPVTENPKFPGYVQIGSGGLIPIAELEAGEVSIRGVTVDKTEQFGIAGSESDPIPLVFPLKE